MKKVILFILLIISINSFSQVRLGRSFDSIKKEFKSYPQIVQDGVLYVFDKDVIISYYFENNICNKVILFTSCETTAEFIIQWYTKEYEKIGNTQWRMLSKECGYANINLIYSEKGYNFIWN